MEEKTAKSEIHLPILPDDLIVEQILPRLPVKSLIRFKSVSKYWFSTISSNKFEKTHLKFSYYCPQVLMLENGYLDGLNYWLSLDECSNVKELGAFYCKYSINVPSDLYITCVKGSDNGLLCLYDASDEDFCFYLCNPAIQQCSRVGSPYDNHPESMGVFVSGFGYVSSIDDYRIGCISEKDQKGRHVDVFSLRTGKWKRTTILDENYYLSVSIDDTIYWPPRVSHGGNDDKSHIFGLNLVSGELNKISLKDVISGYNEVDIFRMKGCLSLGCRSYLKGYHICDVWMLKQHDDCTSWEKIFSLDTGDTRLLYLFEMGKCLLGEYPEELKLLDLSKVTLEECEENTIIWQGSEHIADTLSIACGYVESLISPFGTTKYDDDEDDHEIKE